QLTPFLRPPTSDHRHHRHQRRRKAQPITTYFGSPILSRPVASAAKVQGDQTTIQSRN
ncbi:unnamed protein product, partial [Linum tenue]